MLLLVFVNTFHYYGFIKMKPAIIIIPIFLLFGCNEKNTEIKYQPLTKDEISAERVWQRVTKEYNYEQFPEWPGYNGVQPGQSPHGRFHEIYINPILYNALPVNDRIAPDGSIILKENFNIDLEIVAITVMVKVKDYDPEHNDWYWIKYTEDGEPLNEGKLGLCINCHQGVKDNDYVIVRQLDQELEK